MQLVILAGGFGTRLSEETELLPKPMVEIGAKPILWHIMKIYSHYGVNDFIICLGYKGFIIKNFFANYFLHNSNIKVDLKNGKTEMYGNKTEPWSVTLVDSGEITNTAGRLRYISKFILADDFCLTYGDGLSNINIAELVEFHKENKSMVTLTAVKPTARFGALDIDINNQVKKFEEKQKINESWINGGFMVCRKDLIAKIKEDNLSLENNILPQLANEHQLKAFKHNGFWQNMDNLRDKNYLNTLWNTGSAPWKIWD